VLDPLGVDEAGPLEARLLVVLGVEVVEGLGTVVGGLAARAVLVPPLPQPQEVQLEGDQPPVDWQPVEVASKAVPITPESIHRESTTRMARTSLSKPAPRMRSGCFLLSP
jgi:hypothetical protein